MRCWNAAATSPIDITSTVRSICRRRARRSVTLQREQFRVLGPAAAVQLPGGVDQLERLHVGDDGLHRQPAPVAVGRQRAAKREPICSRLLLADAPGLGFAGLLGAQVGDEFGPPDASLRCDQASLAIECLHARHAAHVEQHAAVAELLAAHGVVTTRDRHGEALVARPGEGPLHVVDRLDVLDSDDACR
jgi:hypothetical protein